MSQLNNRREVLHDEVIKIRGEKEIEKGNVEIELALQWSDAFSESIRCYTNIIRNKDGGTHLSTRSNSFVQRTATQLCQLICQEKEASEGRCSFW